ncbi:MAG: hypothetical protein NTY53_14320 [Kiritimatiellaeota bacterium]|nr:hypothetical protein [Kiritimatiellota bacterium]
MNKQQAHALAKLVGGYTWQSGGGIWLVLITRKDGALVVFSDEVICEYPNQEAFDQGQPTATIRLQ